MSHVLARIQYVESESSASSRLISKLRLPRETNRLASRKPREFDILANSMLKEPCTSILHRTRPSNVSAGSRGEARESPSSSSQGGHCTLTLVCLTCRRVGGGGGGAIGGEMGGVDFFDQSDATPKRPAMLLSLIGRTNSFILVCTRTLKQ